ncbi:hypothetical protein [Streptomyces sp. NPDC017260]|uniref:hypothetical protein n=1 Tax=unclassified Streptomyces TaxID=2593676 RepID=UPI0037A99F77
MTRTTAALNAFRIIAAELADWADTADQDGHHGYAQTCADLGLVYLEFEDADTAHPRVTTAWCAAESARMSLTDGTGIEARARIARARLHLALARREQSADLPTT